MPQNVKLLGLLARQNNVCMYVCMYECVYMCTYVRMYVGTYMYVGNYVRMYVHLFIYILYIYIHTEEIHACPLVLESNMVGLRFQRDQLFPHFLLESERAPRTVFMDVQGLRGSTEKAFFRVDTKQKYHESIHPE